MNNKELKKLVQIAVKRAVIKDHNWSFFKDDTNMYDKICDALLDPKKDQGKCAEIGFGEFNTTLNAHDEASYHIMKTIVNNTDGIKAKAINLIEAHNYNTIAKYLLAFMYANGIHISINHDVIHVYNGCAMKAFDEFIDECGINKDDTNETLDKAVKYLAGKTNLKTLLDDIVGDDSNEPIKYFLYGISELDSGLELIETIAVLKDDDKQLTVVRGVFDSKDNSRISYNRIEFIFLPEKEEQVLNIRISNDAWDGKYYDNCPIDVLVSKISTDIFHSLLALSTIADLKERKVTIKTAEKSYEYSMEHLPLSELPDGDINYNKYEEHLTENEYYPSDRKSPRAHQRKSTWRYNPKTGKKDIFVRGCTVNAVNDEKMTYKKTSLND